MRGASRAFGSISLRTLGLSYSVIQWMVLRTRGSRLSLQSHHHRSDIIRIEDDDRRE
jgi:hypothetical protein